ncbi:translation initiation factor IF-2-like [Acinonyx jubatus]|uniref:Translation initiation factor IF-2-like n=1 Tax=Acinonyx jubatus TaxID=32536 RepID=A0ABM3PHM5_ACIJB|nr:translation initiation factor IF-2-like [Acinonyx jubatus]
MDVMVVMEVVWMSIPIDHNVLLWKDLGRRQIFRVRLIQVIIALGVLCDTVVRADAGGDLSRGNASYLEATFLFHLSSAWRKRLCLQLSLRQEVQALWRRRRWSRRRRCCRRWRLEQRRRRKILGRCGTTTNAGTCCIESRGAATTAAPSREHCRVRHLPSTNVCSGRGRRGGGLRRLVHCVGYRGAEEASAISFCTVIFVFKTPGRKTGPDAPPGAVPPSPPPQPKAPAAPAFEGELREGRMNEGEQGGQGPEGGTPSVLHHSLSPLVSHPPLYSASRGVRGRREGKTRQGGDKWRGWENREMPTFSRQLKSHLNPSSRRGRGGGGRCKTLPVALHESSAERVSPSPRHPQRRRRRRAPSSVSLKPPLPAPLSPLGPPPTPLGPFQTPWARGGCSVSKRWPRLGPGRRGSERGGGGAPGTVSPATRRGRARRDAGSSRSTAGARRRHWQREPRDRSITGSHGARAFSSLRAGASARHTSSGRKGPAPEPPRRAAGCVLAQRGASCFCPLPPQPARPHPAAPAARAGGGRRQRRLLSRRRWWPDGLVQATAADAVQRNESNSITSFSSQEPAATATIRHESGFLPWRVAEPSPSPHLGSPPARVARAL